MKAHLRKCTVPFLLLLGACTSGFVYNRLDSVGYWYLRSQVTLEEHQLQSLREALREFLAWHRAHELPKYVAFLEKLVADGRQGPYSRERIDAAAREAEGLLRELARRAGPDAAVWMASLTPAQLDQWFRNQGDDDAKTRRDYCEAEPAKIARRREREFVKSVESWTGKLEDAQIGIARTGLARLAPDACAWVEDRVASRQRLRELIEQHSRDADFASRVTEFLARPETHWSPQYRKAFVESREIVIDTLAALEPTLSTEQRARRETRFTELASKLRKLAESGGVTKPSSG